MGVREDSMPPPILEASEVIDGFRATFAGWRFLFSSSYPHEFRARWDNESRL